MNASLIDELQLEAAGNAVSVSALLRKALMVAAKLDVSDLPKWIDKELSGYGPDDEVPPYRVVHGRVKGKIIKIMGRWNFRAVSRQQYGKHGLRANGPRVRSLNRRAIARTRASEGRSGA